MAAEMDYPPSFVMLESDFGNGDISSSKDEIGEVSLSYTRSRKPPRHFSIVERDLRSIQLVPNDQPEIDIGEVDLRRCVEKNSEFLPNFRSGSCSEMGPRSCMEDEFVCIDNLLGHVGSSVATSVLPLPAAFYGVFDGHGGTDAASFIKQNILKFIFEDTGFSSCLKTALRSAFLKADEAFAGIDAMDSSSGTTALTALLLGRKLLIANAGDCRAVLGRRGNAVDLSKDHKPNCVTEKLRIERLGGIVYDGYLNGQLSVSRALGDWHMKSSQCPSSSPLTAEPELQEVILTEEDEFLILGCDGLWDVMTSQYAVTITRRELMLHNDPERCSRVLVREALKLNAGDNLTVVVVCFSLDPPLRLERRKSRFRKSISADGLNILQDVLESPA